MVEDQSSRKVKKFIFSVSLFLLLTNLSFAKNFNLEKIVDLNSPWGSSFINNEELIITEKSGKIKVVNIISKQISEIKHNLNFLEHGQGGILDILFKDNFIYVSYTENRGNGKTSTSIAKTKFAEKELKFENIFQANPPINSGYHFGSRLAIKDDYLFASAGERGEGMIAQDPTKHPGSIIRINLDGSIPRDNPRFKGKSNWLPEIYQIGIRNPQGLTLSPFDGKIYMSNHGARGGDWFGEAKEGENYGWKILGWGGTNYSGIPIGPKWKPGFTKAIHYWVPSIATSAITIYKGKEFSEWNGHALVTSLKDQSLRKLIFKDLSNVKTLSLKGEGNFLIVIGKSNNHLGNSKYMTIMRSKEEGGTPKIDLNDELKNGKFVLEVINNKLVESSHDVGEGGILVALTEMCMAGDLGITIDIEKDFPHGFYFGEDQSRYLLEIKEKNYDQIKYVANSYNVFFLYFQNQR